MKPNFNILNDEEYLAAQDGIMLEMPELPARRDPFDPAPLVDLFKKYEVEIDNMDTRALAVDVKDGESNTMAVEMTTQAKNIVQRIEKKRKELKEPYLMVIQTIDGFCKGLTDRLKNTQQIINNKIQPYLQKKDEERREAERKAREEAARIQAEEDAKARAEAERLAEEARQKALAEGKAKEDAEKEAAAAAAMAEPAPVIVVDAGPAETKTVTDAGIAKLKSEWKWEILNFKELPDAAFENRKEEVTKALSPWLNAQVAAGIRNIPGVKIFQQTKIQTRTKRR